MEARRPKRQGSARTKRRALLPRLLALNLIETLSNGEVVVYVGEVDIDLNPKIGPDYILPGR
jgi:hypothetical protein